MIDAAPALLDYFLTNDDTETLRGYVVSTDYIKEAGNLTGTDLDEAESLRLQQADLYSKVLAISVHDAGDSPEGDFRIRQTVVIRIFDRNQGYDRIRPVRDEIRSLLSKPLVLDLGLGQRGLLELRYAGRTGVQFDDDYMVFFEVLTYIVLIEETEE